MKLFFYLLAVVLITFSFHPVSGQQAPAANISSQRSLSISGRVVDRNGAAIPNATIRLASNNSDQVLNAVADGNGVFTLGNVPSGSYRLEILSNGFARSVQTIDVNETAASIPDVVLSPAQLSAEVTVTATRSVESIAAVPSSITVVDEEQLRNQVDLSNSLVDALGKLVPGLAPGSQSISTYGQTLRGRNAMVLIDGVPQSTTRNITRDLATIDPSAIERVEVIRGTTSIYGEGATGGIISITTKRPTEGKLSFTTDIGGSSSLSHPSGSLGGFIRQGVSGKRGPWDFLVNGSFDRTGGFFDAEGDRIAPDPHGQGGLADTNTFNILG